VHKHKNNKTKKKKKKGSPAKANSSSIKKEKPNRFFSNKYTKKKRFLICFSGFACLYDGYVNTNGLFRAMILNEQPFPIHKPQRVQKTLILTK
jgi:hypothetical protein